MGKTRQNGRVVSDGVLTIDENNNVGIGSTDPETKFLDVEGETTSTQIDGAVVGQSQSDVIAFSIALG